MTSAGREGEMFFTTWSGKPLCRNELELKPSGLKTKPKTHQVLMGVKGVSEGGR